MLTVKRHVRLVAAGLALFAVLAAVILLVMPGETPEKAGFTDQIAWGEALYAQNCAACHGGRLEGQPDWRQRKSDGRLPAPPHDETGHTWHHADEQLFGLTKQGLKPPLAPDGYESDMPAFDDILTDVEIRAVLAFIKSTWPPQAKANQDRVDKAFKRQ